MIQCDAFGCEAVWYCMRPRGLCAGAFAPSRKLDLPVMGRRQFLFGFSGIFGRVNNVDRIYCYSGIFGPVENIKGTNR